MQHNSSVSAPRAKHVRRTLMGCAVAALFLFNLPTTASAQTPPTCPQPVANISSPVMPVDVAVGCTLPPGNPIAFFDDFSWRIFVALVWPAANGQRGVPDIYNTTFPNGVPLVFQTYKADWESFPSVGSNPPAPIPTAWQTFAGAQNPCASEVPNAGWSDMILASDTKFGNLGLAGFGSFLVGPLIAQPGAPGSKPTYVRYQAAYNQTEYNQILNNKWYIAANLPPSPGLTFCSNGATINGQACPGENSVDTKASWIDMSGVPSNQQSRYFTRKAWVFDPSANTCSNITVGLVGLHIVAKTPSRSAWIWSSFEQLDNVPPIGATPPFPRPYYNFHDQTATPMPANDPYCIVNSGNTCPNPNANPPSQIMPAVAPAPFNVTRTMQINPSTINTNVAYQALMQKVNSPWQYYQLVMTQWPITSPPNPSAHSGKPSNTFQGINNTGNPPGVGTCPNPPAPQPPTCTSFANVTMETFDQGAIGTGCMNCHNATANTDFLWSLPVNAWVPPQTAASRLTAQAKAPGALTARENSLKELEDLLRGAAQTNTASPPK
jgi:hypothetical protein